MLPSGEASLADAAWADSFGDLAEWTPLSGLEGESLVDYPSTRCEVALPWDQLTASFDDGTISTNAAFHDRDDDTNAWIEWAAGFSARRTSVLRTRRPRRRIVRRHLTVPPPSAPSRPRGLITD